MDAGIQDRGMLWMLEEEECGNRMTPSTPSSAGRVTDVEAMGGTLAKLSVSALMFDYILTGPISGVSAGQYIVGLTAQTLTSLGHPWAPSKETINLLAAGMAILITGYFRWRNIRGMHESSSDALRIAHRSPPGVQGRRRHLDGKIARGEARVILMFNQQDRSLRQIAPLVQMFPA